MLIKNSRWNRDVSTAVFLCLTFVALCLLANAAIASSGQSEFEPLCPAQQSLKSVQVERVIDGDTVVLGDGRHLRIIGVNTPEMNWRKYNSDGVPQPYAREATHFLESWVGSASQTYISLGNEKTDRYGRALAHLYGGKESNITSAAAQLIRRGYGYSLAIPPNLNQASCLKKVEALARSEQLGLWHNFSLQVIEPNKRLKAGFQLLGGRVTKVSKTKNSWWLELDGPLVLRISRKNIGYFDTQMLYGVKGKSISVRGWVIDRGEKYDHHPKGYKRWMMHIFHPLSIDLL
ncbi:MAG: thermonuclease family protein [Pseudomonadales bacterium]|nr:thermonuclease family protein [Pseudomonadales bacterium]